MPANMENSALTTGLEKVSVYSNTKKGECQRMFCWEPAWEIPPMTRSCGRDLTSKVDQDSRDPLDLLEHLPPKPESVCLTILCLSPTLLTLIGGYPRPPFSGKSQLRALVDKSPGHERSISIQTPC